MAANRARRPHPPSVRYAAGLLFFLSIATPGCRAHLEGLLDDVAWIDSDERLLYFDVSSIRDGYLCSMTMRGEDRRCLSDRPVREYELAPDGTRVAMLFEGFRCGIASVDGGSTAEVPGECRGIEWSPSSRQVLVVSARGRLRVLDALTMETTLRAIGDHDEISGDPHWSSAGDRIFFCGLLECHELAYPGGQARVLGENSDQKRIWGDVIGLAEIHWNQWDSRSYSWGVRVSPDGGEVATTEQGSLWLSDRSGQSRRCLVRNTSCYSDFGPRGLMHPYWSADGRFVVCGYDGRQLVVVEAATGRAAVIGSGQNPMLRTPGYSPRPVRGMYLYYSELKLSDGL